MNVKPRTIYEMVAQDRIPYRKPPGSNILRFDLDEILVRYRGPLPAARTKFQAEQAETKLKLSLLEARYGKQTGDKELVEFIDEVYLPRARQNKRTWKHDEFRARTIAESFKGKKFSQIHRF